MYIVNIISLKVSIVILIVLAHWHEHLALSTTKPEYSLTEPLA